LIVDRRDLKVLEVPRYPGPPVHVQEQVVLEPGARALWFVMPGAWYDIGRFHLANGRVTGWYTNFCTPVALETPEWSTTDLFLDHWLSPDGWHRWLDEDELAYATAAGLLTPDLLRQLEDARSLVARLVAAGDWPPGTIRRWPEDPWSPRYDGSSLGPPEV